MKMKKLFAEDDGKRIIGIRGSSIYISGDNLMFKRCVIVAFIFLLSLSLLYGCENNSEAKNVEVEIETKTETKIGYISNINVSDRNFIFDPIEWITMDDTKRIAELGLADGDFPNGFYSYNPTDDVIECTVSDDATYSYLNWKDNFTPTSATFEEFANQHNEFFTNFFEPLGESFENFTPYWIDLKDGVVIDIRQQYVP